MIFLGVEDDGTVSGLNSNKNYEGWSANIAKNNINPAINLKFMENLRYSNRLGRGIPLICRAAQQLNKTIILKKFGEEFRVTLFLRHYKLSDVLNNEAQVAFPELKNIFVKIILFGAIVISVFFYKF